MNFSPGKFLLYPHLWPVSYSVKGKSFSIKGVTHSQLESIKTTSSPLIKTKFHGNELLVLMTLEILLYHTKTEHQQLVALKAIQSGIKEISAASTGNAGSSLAGICARLGIKSHIFVPEKIPLGKRIQIQSFVPIFTWLKEIMIKRSIFV